MPPSASLNPNLQRLAASTGSSRSAGANQKVLTLPVRSSTRRLVVDAAGSLEHVNAQPITGMLTAALAARHLLGLATTPRVHNLEPTFGPGRGFRAG